uniref:Toll-like receptor 13 n=2 Tax=Scophthalmus maximus TaxID=52904 RepID=A0A223G1M8_SCOMX|nr:toll-like receptor 13 [Scophthalmus maximus]
MQAQGSWPLLLVSLLFSLLHANPSLAFSLKNCSIAYFDNATRVFVTCQHRSLSAIPDDIPQNAAGLDLGFNSIQQISRSDLRGLSKLKFVQVVCNLISHVDNGAFTDLTELKSLLMDDNQLTRLTDNTFQGLSKLETLSLNSNYITYISPLAFQPLVNIDTVFLGSNPLHRIAFIAPLLNLPTLHFLMIGNNKFTTFQSDDLHFNVSNLKSLGLSLNPLRKFSITKDVFPYLQSLDLCHCGSDIEWDVSNKTFLKSLTTLYLSGSYVSYTAMLQTTDSVKTISLIFMENLVAEGLIDIACRVPSLRSLAVTNSRIGIIDENLLQSCSQLTELTLSANQLTELSELSFRSTTQLRRLRLDSNELSKVPLALRELFTVEVLDLQSNFISELDCLDFQLLTRLTDLNLNQNRISKLQGCLFQNLNDLKVLDIGDNALFTFDDTFKVNLGKLESLNLHNNGLLQLMQGDFRSLSSLTFLDLDSDTYYNVINGAFEGLDNLQTLILSIDQYQNDYFRGLQHLENLTLHLTFNWHHMSPQHNVEPPFGNLPNLKKLVLQVDEKYHVDSSPDMLGGLKSLEYFMADRLFMKIIHPDTFKYTPQLKGLQIINSNLIEVDPELFRPIPNLQTLDLSNNKLRSLDFLAQANLQALVWLTLNKNELSIINETVLQSLPALTYLVLNGNPLTCECSNYGFNQWVLSNNQTQVVDAYGYTCAFPVSQQGNKFLDFDIHSCWMNTSFICFISSTSLIVLTLLASFVYHFLRWHLAYAYYLFLAYLYDKRRRKTGTPHHYDAFVSYNVHDEAWVYNELVPVLEEQQGWRVCLHHRDFEPGKPIVENITDAIYGSRKTICVISRNYLQSEWCSREIQMASCRLFDEQEDVLILLFLEDIPARQLSPYYRMKSLVKSCTYLSWAKAGQHTEAFWMNLWRALETAGRPADDEHTRHLLTGHPSDV